MKETTIELLHIKNPNAIDLDEIKPLIEQAFKNVTLTPNPIGRLAETIPLPHITLILMRVDGEYKGLAWLAHPQREDDVSTTVLHFYCKSFNSVARERLIREVVRSAREHGASKLFAWDLHKKPRAFVKIFRSAGEAKEVVRAYEFDLPSE